MELSDSQKGVISGWVADGLKLGDIQRRLGEAFGISLTYMETRFLLDDLNLDLISQPKTVDSDLSQAVHGELEGARKREESEDFSDAAPERGKVKVSLHRINRPGAVAGGKVTFSDGNAAEWALDQIGRLVLNAEKDGYQPTEGDLEEFQRELSALLQNRGY